MKNKHSAAKVTCLEPEYVAKFRCDATKCDAFCCQAHWGIDIDRGTYQKYQKITPKRIRQNILSRLKYNPSTNGYRTLSADGKYCGFLTQEHLCSLQKELGEDYLSDTCITYPRRLNIIDGIVERGLLMSCPVAAKLVLSDTEAVHITSVDVTGKRLAVIDTLSSEDDVRINYFADIQSVGIRILQDRSYTVDERLALLGLFIVETEKAFNTQDGEYLQNFTAAYQAQAYNDSWPEIKKSLIFDKTKYRQNIESLIESVYKDKPDFTDKHKTLLQAAQNTDYDKTHDEVARLAKNCGRLWENYLVNEYFLMLYPFRIKESMALSFQLFLAAFKLTEFFAARYVMTQNGKDTAENLIVKAVVTMSELLDHNNDYVGALALSAVKLDMELKDFLNGYIDVG